LGIRKAVKLIAAIDGVDRLGTLRKGAEVIKGALDLAFQFIEQLRVF
jgi:hypothetical protein